MRALCRLTQSAQGARGAECASKDSPPDIHEDASHVVPSYYVDAHVRNFGVCMMASGSTDHERGMAVQAQNAGYLFAASVPHTFSWCKLPSRDMTEVAFNFRCLKER